MYKQTVKHDLTFSCFRRPLSLSMRRRRGRSNRRLRKILWTRDSAVVDLVVKQTARIRRQNNSHSHPILPSFSPQYDGQVKVESIKIVLKCLQSRNTLLTYQGNVCPDQWIELYTYWIQNTLILVMPDFKWDRRTVSGTEDIGNVWLP